MDSATKSFVARKVLENILITAIIFCLWVYFLSLVSYFAFGLVVALVLMWKQSTYIKDPRYILVFINDLILWPSQILVNIIYGHS